MYKLYIKSLNGSSYQGPYMFNSYQKALDNATDEYIIIENKGNEDVVVAHDVIKNNKRSYRKVNRKRDDYDFER